MADVIIIGRGPAGLSAAIYTARAGLETLDAGPMGGALMKTERIENYFGFPEPVSGKKLLENGAAQAARLGVKFADEEAVGISYGSGFSVSVASGKTYEAPFLILATGTSRKAPQIVGLKEFEGRGVSYCAICDAFFYRKKEVAVLGSGDYALHEAQALLQTAAKVTVLTNGENPTASFPPQINVVTKKIGSLYGDGTLKGIKFQDGSELPAAGAFVAVGVAGSTDLARKVGVETKGNVIVTDQNMRTNVPGLYAAGDCTGGLLQVSKAVCDGAVAGVSVSREFHRKG